MVTHKIQPRARKSADIRLAGAALAFAVLHERDRHSAALIDLVQKYEDKIKAPANGADVRGYLVQFAAEAHGVFTDRLADGYTAWARAEVIQCPSCEGEMRNDGDFVCGDCGYRETR